MERFKRTHFDWQPPLPTSRPTPTTSTTTTTVQPPHVEIVNVTSMLIRDGTARIAADVVMHKEEAEGIGDAGIILWGRPQTVGTTTTEKASAVSSPGQLAKSLTTTTESNIEKIMDSMPTANEDMIRILQLSKDEQYGHGHAKPKYISIALATMKSIEYPGEITTTTPTTTTTTAATTKKPHRKTTIAAVPSTKSPSTTTSTDAGKRSTDKQTSKVQHKDVTRTSNNATVTHLPHKTDEIKPIVEHQPADLTREIFRAPLIASTTAKSDENSSTVPSITSAPKTTITKSTSQSTTAHSSSTVETPMSTASSSSSTTESYKDPTTTTPRLLIDLLVDKSIDQAQTILVEIPISLVTADAEKTHLGYSPISKA